MFLQSDCRQWGGDSGSWGTVLNTFLNVSHNESGELRPHNLSVTQKITFAFGEVIDNIINGIIRITGNLNVTGYNLTVDNADFNGGWLNNGVSIIDGDIYAQVGYFYNITSLNVTKQNLTIIEDLYVEGNVGIGTTGPAVNLHIQKSGTAPVDYTSFQFVPLLIEDTTKTGMTFLSEKTGEVDIIFADQGGNARAAGINYNFNTDLMTFRTGGSDNVFINSTGNVGIGTATPNEKLTINGSISLFAGNYTPGVTDGYVKLFARNGTDGNDQYTKLLLHMDGEHGSTTFTDSSDSEHDVTVAVGNIHISTDEQVFGVSSSYSEDIDTWLSAPDSEEWNIADGDFTIDLWVKHGNHVGSEAYIGQGESNDYYWFIRNIHGADLRFIYKNTVTHRIDLVSPEIADSDWHHIAVVKSGTSWKLYKDGIEEDSATSSLTPKDMNAVLTIGDIDWTAANHFHGYLDEVRISKGIARWTDNFTVPTYPYDKGGLYYKDGEGTIVELVGGKSFAWSSYWVKDGDDIYSDNAGNVGIGTISPTSKLHVEGNVNITGNLTVDGQVSITGASRARATREITQTIVTATITPIQYNVEVYDNLGEYDSTTNYNFTATEAGYYLVKASLLFSQYAWADGNVLWMAIYRDTALKSYLDYHRIEYDTFQAQFLGGSDIIYLDAGQSINVRVYHNRGANTKTIDDGRYCNFAVHRLS